METPWLSGEALRMALLSLLIYPGNAAANETAAMNKLVPVQPVVPEPRIGQGQAFSYALPPVRR